MRTVGFALALVAGLTLGATAHAQSTKGAGKTSLSIIKFPVVNIQQKAAGTLASKPAASVALKPPTGGALTSVKLAKDIGDPLKPGFPAGDYVLDIETSGVGPDGNADAGGNVAAFVTLTVNALFKCTVHPNDSVNGDGINDACGTMADPNLCAPEVAGKCNFTTYQAAGKPNYLLQPGDGQPVASRVRLRKLTNPANCHTGDIILLGSPQPPSSDCRNAANTVVGVMGTANGDVDP
jgi:hypothetical protein